MYLNVRLAMIVIIIIIINNNDNNIMLISVNNYNYIL